MDIHPGSDAGISSELDYCVSIPTPYAGRWIRFPVAFAGQVWVWTSVQILLAVVAFASRVWTLRFAFEISASSSCDTPVKKRDFMRGYERV